MDKNQKTFRCSLDDFGTNISPSPRRSLTSKCEEAATSSIPGTRERDELQAVTTLVQWAICGPHSYKPVSITYDKLEKGVYGIYANPNHGIIFERKDICVDDLLRFPDSVSDKILNEITTFWGKGDKFKEHGFLHRRGYLLHGPAGSGKTCLVQQIIADIVKNDGLVFQCSNHPSVFNDGLALFRKVEPNRPTVCLFEDIDAIIDEYGEDDILTLLDGENQIDRVLNIATTNYPENLDRRLVARPRRFDRVIKVDMPSNDVRRMYFIHKLKVSVSELDMWVEASEGFSFAACAELVISVCCFEKTFEESVKTLREMMTTKVSSHDYDTETNPPGFGMK